MRSTPAGWLWEVDEMKKIAIEPARRGSSHRRGNVMIEFVMVIPLLGFILGLTFFFGWAMANQQHVKTTDRFQSWRRVRAGSGVPQKQLNDWIFQGHLGSYNQNAGTYTTETRKTLEELVSYVGNVSPRAEGLAREVVMEKCEKGRWVTASGTFPSDIALFQEFHGSIKHTHMRDGREWRWRQLWCEQEIRDEFLSELDTTLKGVPSPGDSLASMARRLYLTRW